MLKNCCFCVSLKKGSFIVAIFSLIYYTSVVLIGAFHLNTDSHYSKGLVVLSLFLVLLGGLCVASALLLLVGLSVDCRHLLLPWMAFVTCTTILDIVYAFLWVSEAITSSRFKSEKHLIFVLFIDLIVCAFNFYSILLVLSQFQSYSRTTEERVKRREDLSIGSNFELFGLFLIIFSSILFLFFPKLLEIQIKKNLNLHNQSEAFERWRVNSVPILVKFHFFEPKNQNAFELRTRGPYVYEEAREKHVLAYEGNGSLVKYRERRYFRFRRDLSSGSEDDVIEVINAPLMGILFNKAIPSAKMGFELFKDYLDEEEVKFWRKVKVKELLFEGIEMKLFRLLGPFLSEDIGFTLDSAFSIFQGRNYSEPEWKVGTGTGNQKLNEIKAFNGFEELRNSDQSDSLIWNHVSEDCNQLRGSDGSLFSPPIREESVLHVFEPQICRSLLFRFQKSSKVKEIETKRFFVSKDNFLSPKDHAPNTCFCTKEHVEECTRSGILDVSRCLRVSKGASITFSQPYFMDGDESLRTEMGLKAPEVLNLENFGTFLDIEPRTGLVLRAKKRIQLNIEVKRDENIAELESLEKELIVPLLWLEEGAELDEKSSLEFKSSLVYFLPKIISFISIFSLIFGLIFILFAFLLLLNE